MKLIDKYLGVPLCFLIKPFIKRVEPEVDVKKINKILIIKMFGIGSIILMSPLINKIKSKYPYIKIFFLTFEKNKEIVWLYKLADEVITIESDSFLKFILSTLKALLKIRKERIQLYIDGEFFSRYTALFGFLSGIKIRTGFFAKKIFRGNIINKKCYFNLYKHMAINFLYLGVASKIIEENEITSNKFSLSFPAIPELPPQKFKFLSQKFILFNPTVSDITPYIDRKWPFDYFVKLGTFLTKKGYTIVIIGTNKYKNYCKKMAKEIGKKAFSIAGETDLKTLVTLIYYSFAIITNDSGPLHIAASLNVPTFTFFGTDTPVLYGYTNKIHTAFYKNLQCSPCLNVFNYKENKCESNVKCLKTITPEEVINKFIKQEKLLNYHYIKRKRNLK